MHSDMTKRFKIILDRKTWNPIFEHASVLLHESNIEQTRIFFKVYSGGADIRSWSTSIKEVVLCQYVWQHTTTRIC